MQILRSPDDAIADVIDYPSARRYIEIPAGDGQRLRVHVVDAGPPDGPVVVFLHGNPSWSYIWRYQIEAVVAAGYRAIAPDLVGMGMSDKPSELTDYSVAGHVEWMRSLLLDALALHDMTFVLHDWGGVIGMRIAAEHPERAERLVISNTGLPWRDLEEPLPDPIEASGPYVAFQEMARVAPVWEPWAMLPMVMASPPSEAVQHAYRAPYPDPSLTIGSRAFTQLLPTRLDNPMYPDNYRAWKVFEQWTKPVLTIFSDRDVVAPHGWKPIVERIPGAFGQPHVILKGGGHFLQEDVSEAYNAALLAWLDSTGSHAHAPTR
jgi:haloalkane dehalogenase